ncbi:hypothetical protein ACFW04_010516 [Cataglyphis niger]
MRPIKEEKKEEEEDKFELSTHAGVYPADRVPRVWTRSTAIVANTDEHNRPGEHWVAFFLDEHGSATYFDSYGISPLTILTIGRVSSEVAVRTVTDGPHEPARPPQAEAARCGSRCWMPSTWAAGTTISKCTAFVLRHTKTATKAL